MTYNKRDLLRSWHGSLPDDEAADWLRRRKACDKSLFYFIKDCGGYVLKSGGDISPQIHKPICDRWQDKSVLRQACFMPRKWRKTTAYTIWSSIWEYLQDNEIRILIPSEKELTAMRWVRQIGRQIRRNDRLRWIYPELQLVNDRWVKSNPFSGQEIMLPRIGDYPESTISCVGVRGASQGGHYNLINADDLVGEKGFESPIVMEDAFRWFDNAEELLDDPEDRIRILGTHWGPGDLGVYIQEDYPEYLWYIVPCRKDSGLLDTENITYIQADTEDGETNWPEAFSTKHYVDMESNPEKQTIYYAQHMNNPRAASVLTKFDGAWLRYYKFEDRKNSQGDFEKWVVCEEDGKAWQVGEMTLYGMIDPGGFAEMKLLKKGSRNAIVVGGQPKDANRKFIIYTWCGRLKEPDDFLKEVFFANELWNVRLWMVEVFGAQKYIYRDILQYRKQHNKNLSIQEMPKDVSKDVKDSDILGLMAPMQNGEIYVHRSMRELIGEIRTFPSCLTRDLIDMTGKLMKYRFKRGKQGEKEERDVFDGVKIDAYVPELGESGVSAITGY